MAYGRHKHCVSGVITSDVETAKAKGVPVARFYIDVAGAGDRRPHGNFKVVALAGSGPLSGELC